MAARLGVDAKAGLRATLRCWGDFALHDAASGDDLRPRGRKARALLAYLAMHPGKPISRERLMGLLWGERPHEQARSSLRQTLFELRDFSRADPPFLRIEREAVALQPGAIRTDIDRWRQLAGDGDYETLLAEIPEADETLFANLDGLDAGFDEWLQVERTRQREALIVLLSDASAGALAAGRTRAARALHARLVELNPEEATPAPATAPLAPLGEVRAPRRHSVAALAAGLVALSAIGAIWVGSGRQPIPASASTPSREVRDLYESARGIIYQRQGAQFPLAEKLLRRALSIDPNYVPAMAALAAITEMSNSTPDSHREAERLARRAVQLDPNSATANGVLGMVLRFESDEARAAIKKAASLDGNDPEIQFWLSNVLSIEGDYIGRLQALRRAAAIDPLWHRASGVAALAAWEMGHSAEADRYAAQLREADPSVAFQCDYALDWAEGDYSGVVRDTLAAREKLNDSKMADWKLGIALLVLGHEQPARLLLRLPPPLWRIATDAGPAPGELEPLMIAANTEDRASFFALTGLRQVLRDGRAKEIVGAYDRRVGPLAGVASGKGPKEEIINYGLQVAQALAAVGRKQEAAILLARADAALRGSLARGSVPNWLYASAAGVWAAQGRREEALKALETALDRGWHYSPMTPLPDMGEIPSFASLRGDPRFERLRQRELDHLARERRELGPVPV